MSLSCHFTLYSVIVMFSVDILDNTKIREKYIRLFLTPNSKKIYNKNRCFQKSSNAYGKRKELPSSVCVKYLGRLSNTFNVFFLLLVMGSLRRVPIGHHASPNKYITISASRPSLCSTEIRECFQTHFVFRLPGLC